MLHTRLYGSLKSLIQTGIVMTVFFFLKTGLFSSHFQCKKEEAYFQNWHFIKSGLFLKVLGYITKCDLELSPMSLGQKHDYFLQVGLNSEVETGRHTDGQIEEYRLKTNRWTETRWFLYTPQNLFVCMCVEGGGGEGEESNFLFFPLNSKKSSNTHFFWYFVSHFFWCFNSHFFWCFSTHSLTRSIFCFSLQSCNIMKTICFGCKGDQY